MERPFTRLIGLLVIGLLHSSCGGVSDAKPEPADQGAVSVTVGSADEVTSRVLASLLVVSLEDRGTVVASQIGLGDTDQNRDALLAGEINVYPEDVSNGWQIHLGEDGSILDGVELGDEVARLDLRRNGVRWSGLSDFDASLGFAAKPRSSSDVKADEEALLAQDEESAEDSLDPQDGEARVALADEVLDNNGWSFGALARLLERDSDAKLCVTEAFLESREGLVKFESFTGFTVPNEQLIVSVEGASEESLAARVGDGSCVAATLNRVSGYLGSKELVPIGPPSAGLFPPRNFGYSFARSSFEANEQMFLDITISIFESLNRSTMAELNAQVLSGKDPMQVAADHLRQAGLIGS